MDKDLVFPGGLVLVVNFQVFLMPRYCFASVTVCILAAFDIFIVLNILLSDLWLTFLLCPIRCVLSEQWPTVESCVQIFVPRKKTKRCRVFLVTVNVFSAGVKKTS